MLIMPALRRPNNLRTGTIISIVKGLAVVDLDLGGSVTVHPSTYKSGSFEIGDRVEVLGGSASTQVESAWREQ